MNKERPDVEVERPPGADLITLKEFNEWCANQFRRNSGQQAIRDMVERFEWGLVFGRTFWCNTHNCHADHERDCTSAWKRQGIRGGIMLPCQIVETTGIVEITREDLPKKANP